MSEADIAFQSVFCSQGKVVSYIQFRYQSAPIFVFSAFRIVPNGSAFLGMCRIRFNTDVLQ